MGGPDSVYASTERLVKQDGRGDEQLLELIARREREALESLYDRYARGVYSLAVRMLRDSGAAEEVTQDVFFRVWRQASTYRSQRGSVSAWLFGIAHHRTIDELRRRRREQTRVQLGVDLSNRPSTDGDDPLEYATAQSDHRWINEALHTLRPEQREVVVLAYFGGLTHTEIADRLGQPLGTVKTRMRLALKRLREVINPQNQQREEYGL